MARKTPRGIARRGIKASAKPSAAPSEPHKEVKVDAKVNDAYFGKDKSKEKRSAEEEFFSEGKPKAKEAYPEAKASDQKSVDAAVLGAVKKTEHLAKYLKASWGLSKGQYPHQITF
ncbi:hypothetical protein FRC03_002387 [Tulasnella sp. 419]|nr:hypothetical protein FRC03_002387 [Tulasnella sp. 419]